jgi:transposase
VPATLSARVRLLGCGKASKNDPNDAHSAALAGLRHTGPRVVAREDHTAVLRLLADRHHDLTALRTQAVCRLHALLCALAPGGLGRKLSAVRAADLLNTICPEVQVEIERKQLAQELLSDVGRLDAQLAASKARIQAAVVASGTTVTEVYGVGPIVAALLVGHSGDIRRFRSKDHYASYNATAPIQASSGPRTRHRLNPAGNRQLNHALHMAAVTQVRNNTPRRAYYQRKLGRRQRQDRSATGTEAACERRGLPPTHPRREQPLTRPGRTTRDVLAPAWSALHPELPAVRISHSQTATTTRPHSKPATPAAFRMHSNPDLTQKGFDTGQGWDMGTRCLHAPLSVIACLR